MCWYDMQLKGTTYPRTEPVPYLEKKMTKAEQARILITTKQEGDIKAVYKWIDGYVIPALVRGSGEEVNVYVKPKDVPNDLVKSILGKEGFDAQLITPRGHMEQPYWKIGLPPGGE